MRVNFFWFLVGFWIVISYYISVNKMIVKIIIGSCLALMVASCNEPKSKTHMIEETISEPILLDSTDSNSIGCAH